MKTLLLSASIILAAGIPSVTSAYAGPASATLATTNEPASNGEAIRVVRVTTSAAKETNCETATWPNIPPSCLQREDTAQPTTISLNN
jgi:hypothetical protein